MSRLYFCILLFICHSCSSISGFQDGKTLGKSNTELESSIVFSKVPAIKSTDYKFSGAGLNLGLHLRHGLDSKTDIGLSVNSNLSASVSLKRQILGDQYSYRAMAAGIEIGTGTNTFGFYTKAISIPLFFSIHPEESYSLYFSPIYTAEFIASTVIHNYGGNVGILSGEWNKTGMEFGYYRDNNSGTGIFIVGIALNFKLNKKPTSKAPYKFK